MSGIRVIGHATDGDSAIALVESLRPDVVIMDIRMPGSLSSFQAIKLIMESTPDTKIILATSYAERNMLVEHLDSGATGYILKESPHEVLQEAIRSVYKDTPFVDFGLIPLVIEKEELLTKAETKVVGHLAEGMTNIEIATVLFISSETVKTHIRNISKKLEANTRTHAVAIAIRRRLV